MIVDKVTPQEIVDYLNSLLEVDRVAVSELFRYRVGCNKTMQDHPTVQVAVYADKQNPNAPIPRVGILGILNGLLGVFESSGWGCITMNLNTEDPQLIQNFQFLTDAQVQQLIKGVR